jgi:hypothetical protein
MGRDPDLRPGRFTNQQPTPPSRRITDVVIQRFDGIYEVDAALMQGYFRQQQMPPWDTLRIVAARHDHIRDIHGQFADSVVLASEDSEVDAGGPFRPTR